MFCDMNPYDTLRSQEPSEGKFYQFTKKMSIRVAALLALSVILWISDLLLFSLLRKVLMKSESIFGWPEKIHHRNLFDTLRPLPMSYCGTVWSCGKKRDCFFQVMVGAWTRISCPPDTLVMLLWDNFDKLIYVKLKDGGDICFVIFLEMFGRVLRQLGCSWDVLVVDPGLVPKLQEFWWILPEATSILCRKEQRETFPKPSSKDLFEKMSKLKKNKWNHHKNPKNTDAVLMQFWCCFGAVFKTASKLHQNSKTAPKLHQNCINVFWIFVMISFVFFGVCSVFQVNL